jgi:hypothetical protein
MPCNQSEPDYLCQGWRDRAEKIRARDGNRCRGCNRSNEVASLQVHHRRYGAHGNCGMCILTGVTDTDLVTLCVQCHDSITNVRRELRYADKKHEPIILEHPEQTSVVLKTKTKITATVVEEIKIRPSIPMRRKTI